MSTKSVIIASVALVILFILWASFGYAVPLLFIRAATKGDMEKVGQWGDSFGVFNALVSAGGFALVLANLAEQRKTTAAQALDLHKQRFEGSFFELLKLMRELRGEVSFSHSTDYARSKVQGKGIGLSLAQGKLASARIDTAAVQACIREMHYWLTEQAMATNTARNDLVNVYMRRVHSKSEATLGPYFRVVYTMLRRVKMDGMLSQSEKIEYANLLRSQLTSPEIILIAVNALAPVANDLSDYLTEFHMLKYMNGDAWRRRLQNLYPDQAFSGRTEIE